MRKKILVTGMHGQLGREIAEIAPSFGSFDFTFLDRLLLDLSNMEAIKNYFETNQFDVIINAAAYTAVDKAEEDVNLYKIF